MAQTPGPTRKYVSKKFKQFASRAWEATFAAAMIISGVWDTFSTSVNPVEIDQLLAREVYMIYGVYLMVSSALILIAIFNPCHLWARRIERTGMLLASVTMGTMAWLLETNEEIVSTPDYERVEHYYLVGLIIFSLASLARYWYLGRQSDTEKIVHLVHTQMGTELRRRSDDV